MDFLQRLFLESPVHLGIFSFILLAIALYARRRYLDTFGPRLVPATLAAIALLFAIQRVVMTDRERILKSMDEFVAAIEVKDSTLVDRTLSEQYDSEEMGKAEIAGCIRGILDQVKIYDTRFHRRDVTVTDDRADMLLAARATISIDGGVGQMHWGSWRIGWRREGGVWRIIAIRPLMLDAREIRGMNELRRITP